MLSVAELPLYLRVDAGADIGVGHFARCFALAQFWVEQGGLATIVGDAPPPLLDRLARERISRVHVGARHPDRADLTATLGSIPAGVAVVLDGIGFDTAYEDALADGRTLLVVDDTAKRSRIAGDLLLNQNLGAERLAYDVAPPVRLLGARHALLRREFRRAYAPPKIAERARRVLITFGGADPVNATARVLEAIAPAIGLDIELRVAVGPANRHRRQLDALAASLGDGVRLLDDPDMREQLEWAELAISGAGTTTWELASMGVPSVLVAIAEDQRLTGSEMQSRGAARYLGEWESLTTDELVCAVGELLGDPEQRRAMSTTARALMDGRGCERVAEAICTHGERRRVRTESILGLRR